MEVRMHVLWQKIKDVKTQIESGITTSAAVSVKILKEIIRTKKIIFRMQLLVIGIASINGDSLIASDELIDALTQPYN